MTQRKPFRELYNFIMNALMFLALAVLFQKVLLRDLAPWQGVLYFLPCFLMYPMGRILHSKKPLLAVPIGFFASLLVSLFPILLSWEVGILTIICYILTPVATFIFFTSAYISGGSLIGSRRYITGIGIFLLGAFFKGAHYQSYTLFINISAVLFLVAGLLTFNRESMRDATRHGASVGASRLPPGMRRSNLILVVSLIIIAFLLASVKSLKTLVADIIILIIFAIMAVINFIGKIMGLGGDGAPEGGGDVGFPMGDLAKTQNPVVEMIVKAIITVILIALALGIIYAIAKLISSLISNMPGWLANFFGKFDHAQDDSFTDLTEDLLDKGGLRKEISKNLRKFFDRMSYRPPRFDSLPDNTAKLRFVFKAVLKDMQQKQADTITKTPNELTAQVEPLAKESTDAFIEAYNIARYSKSDPSDEAAKLAKKILRRV